MILITGATDGIGLETAKQLARQGQELVLHGRSADKATRARDAVRRTAPSAALHTAQADFADLSAVAGLAQDLLFRLPRLYVLINNAGVYMAKHQLSRDGFEMTLAVNHIAHFLLTLRLLPLLRKSPSPRVITVSSGVHWSGHISFDDMNAERHFDGYRAYANSKLANALFARELARREPWLASNCLHPGVIDTKLMRVGFSGPGNSVAAGARTPVFLATSPEVEGISGKYFEDCEVVAPSESVEDARLARQLWEWTERAVQPWLAA